jgi:hypothetical protein
MSIWKFLTGAVEPITRLVDDLHTSEEERLQIKSKLFEMQSQLSSQILDYEKAQLDAKSQLILAEAQGASWLQRNWRPITMLTFLALVVLDSFGLLAFRLASEAWSLLQIGLGGYVVGRSVEKIVPKVSQVMRKD